MAGCPVIKVPKHSRLNSLGTKGNHLTTIFNKNTAFKEINNQTSVTVQRDVPQNDNLEKLTRDTQQLAPERKKQYWKENKCWLDKKRTVIWTK